MLAHELGKADYRIPDSDRHSSKKFWGGWTEKDVSMFVICFFACYGTDSFRFFYGQTYYTKNGSCVTTMLRCPLQYR